MSIVKSKKISSIYMLHAFGSFDTKIEQEGAQYAEISIKQIADRVKSPSAMPKRDAEFIIPSTYTKHDGRRHEAQRLHGQFWIMGIDVDSGNVSKEELVNSVRMCVGDVAMMVYSSSSSSEDNKKWRVLVPLAEPVDGKDFSDIQTQFFDALSSLGLSPDYVLARTGQPVYLPNVPPERRQGGVPEGEPLFYDYALERGNGFLHVQAHPMWADMLERRRVRLEAEESAAKESERKRAERERRMQTQDDVSPVDAFNSVNKIADLFDRYGYVRQGSSQSYRSPLSSTGSYAVKDFGEHWVSLSGSDAAAGIGNQKFIGQAAYAWGDAFDLYCYYEHGGNFEDAVRAFGAEISKDRDPFAEINKSLPKADDFSDFDDIEPEPAETETAPVDTIPDDAFAADTPSVQIEDKADIAPTYPTPVGEIDEAALPRRKWIYGRTFIRSFVTVTAAAGGIGKSSQSIVEALAIASGRDLLGERVHERTNVWIVNLEDPLVEGQMRLAAAMKYHGVKHADIAGRLFMDGEDTISMVLAQEGKSGIETNDALLNYIRDKIIENQIGLVIFDPFVSMHLVDENSASRLNAVVSMLRRLARETDACVEVVHHIRKTGGEEATIDSVRGSGAIVGAARSVRIINRVQIDDAVALGFDEKDATGIFTVADGKANLAPMREHAIYRRMVSQELANGEWVGVATEIKLPDPFDGVTGALARKVQQAVADAEANGEPARENSQANAWVGNLIAEVIDLDMEKPKDKQRVKMMIKTWITTGVLRKVMMPDTRNGREMPCIVVGEWIKWDEV